MPPSLEFLFRLLDASPPAEISAEELDGPHGELLRACRRLGFLADEPGMNPIPSCPYCVSGTPYLLGDRYVCNHCRSRVARRHLQLWRLDLAGLLRWYSREQGLRGEVERVDDGLWRLGTFDDGRLARECFYVRGRESSDLARRRLAAFRSVLLLHGRDERPQCEALDARFLRMAEALVFRGNRLAVRPLAELLDDRRAGAVRFDRRTGTLSLGTDFLGRIAPGTREFAFLECLAVARGEVVAYGDLKRAVCLATGSIDSRDEATYCHRLKSRLKRDHGIVAIDRLIEADRVTGGYRLLREAVLREAGGASWDGGRAAGGAEVPAGC